MEPKIETEIYMTIREIEYMMISMEVETEIEIEIEKEINMVTKIEKIIDMITKVLELMVKEKKEWADVVDVIEYSLEDY